MLPAWCIIFAVAIRLIGGAAYAQAVIKGRAKPNPITWFFWGVVPMIVFVAQVTEGAWIAAIMSLALGISPMVIFLLSLKKNWSRAHFTPATTACAVVAAGGIVAWQLTDNPMLAILFSIIADIFASIPTIIKAYAHPKSEVALPYVLSMVSMVITLFTITQWTLAAYAFPVYMLLINLVIFSVVYFKLGRPHHRLQPKQLDNRL